MAIKPKRTVCRLAQFGLTTANANVLAAFYERAFGCRRISEQRLQGQMFERLAGVRGGANRITLGLGKQLIELLCFDRPGRPYSRQFSACDLSFQHFAIVVADIQLAWQRLLAVGGWTAITQGPPQQLPKSSGAVSAFKFRDPEGHPLELLAFPAANIPPQWREKDGAALWLGIDHSAISVADSDTSLAFYRDLGFQVAAQNLNRGVEQERLDGLPEALVEVTALTAPICAPHLELLGYRRPVAPALAPLSFASNDIAASRLILEPCPASYQAAPDLLVDPDGHHLIIAAGHDPWSWK